MERRKLGKTGPEVGVIGLGTEHLDRSQETMDAVLRAAVEAGANYVDLLYVETEYWNAYGSLFRTYRDHLVLAAHWGSGPRYDLEYCQRTFANMLSSVGNDRVEVAMMTMIDDGERKGSSWREASLEKLRRYQEQGRVGLVGGSAHDPAIAREAVRSGLLDVLMFPINMLGYDDEPTNKLIQACVDHGVSLVAMKPYHGGTLFWANGQPTGITPEQCLQYVFSLPVSTAVPGPKNLEEWQATLRVAQASDEEKDFRPVLGSLHDRLAGQCVYCHHCLPCPEEIEIGWVIWHVDHVPGGDLEQMREWYSGFPVKASACVECGICLERCPFDVDIMAKLEQAVALFETPAAA
jgi:predicted aldo/keto reductase-like oxidoreductase